MVLLRRYSVVYIPVLLFSIVPICVDAFNVDVDSKVIYDGPRGSCDQDCMFGFSVAQHKEKGNPWLLVGAPTAESGQPGIQKAGAVYKCQPDNPDSCEIIPFDKKGNTLAPTNQIYDKKSNQWFGAVVKSSGDNGVILACAPRYIYYVFMNRMDPVGTCFTAKSVTDFTEKNFRQFRPCVELGSYANDNNKKPSDKGSYNVRPIGNGKYVKIETENDALYMVCGDEKKADRDLCDIYEIVNGTNVPVGKWGYHRQGSCQAGLGAAIADNGEQVFVGAPGSWYWQGQVYSINITNPNIRRRPHGRGQVFSQNLAQLRDQSKTGEGSPEDDDSYLGYSVATGEFNGDGDDADVVVGMPRGNDLTGKVLIYNANLTNLHNITGQQIGEYFGYSVASADLNGDGRDDIIIGAPMWTDYKVMGKYETGRVYVVYQSTEHRFANFDTLEGNQNHKARFGMSVACAGNLNLDGFSNSGPKGIEDLIVGAPYDGPDNRGAVYIYLGSVDGILKKYAQVIYAEDISNQVRTFGWSLSAGMDLDQNKYPDLLVGAYDSSNAVYLKSAPVVQMESRIGFRLRRKQINLDVRNCTLPRSNDRVPCVHIEVSMKYNGIGVPPRIDLDMQYVLDAKKTGKNRRMFFLNNEGKTERNSSVQLQKGVEWTDQFTVYVPVSIRDKLTSIDAQVKYSLRSRNSGGYYGRSRRELTPVLGQFDKMAIDSVSIKKNCGNDDHCIPNLTLEASHMGAYVIGSGSKLEITADVTNNGEDAFNAKLYLRIPSGIDYISANSSNTDVTVLCTPPTKNNNQTLDCELGNPLPAGRKVKVRIFLQPTEDRQELKLTEYTFSLAVNSSNLEEPESQQDNQRSIKIPVEVAADWKITGTSKPEFVEYNISEELPDKYRFEDELGTEVFHVYDIKNKGPSTIQEAEVFILWPSFNEDGKHLLYLLGVDDDDPKITCDPIRNINPLYVKTLNSRGYSAAFGRTQTKTRTGYSGSSSYSGGQTSQSGSFASSSKSYGYGQAGNIGSQSGEQTYYETSYSSSNSQPGTVGKASSGSSYQDTRVGSSVRYRGSGGHAQVAEGAEETRLVDSGASYQGRGSYSSSGGSSGRQTGGGYRSSYDYERKYENEASDNQKNNNNANTYYNVNTEQSYGGGDTYETRQGSGQSSGGSYGQGNSYGNRGSYGGNSYNREGSRGTISASGWKLLSNGSYIRMYDAKSTAENSRGSGYNENVDSGSRNSGWVKMPDGSMRRKTSHWSSTSSSSTSLSGAGQVESSETSGSAGSQFESSSRSQSGSSGSSFGLSSSSEPTNQQNRGGFRETGNSDQESQNTVFNAALGPGDYHGTMRKTELEQEAGGNLFSSSNSETRNQVENTRYHGGTVNVGSNFGSTTFGRGSGGQGSYGNNYDQNGGSSVNRVSSGSSQTSYGSRNSGQGSSVNYGSSGSVQGSSVNYGSSSSSQGSSVHHGFSDPNQSSSVHYGSSGASQASSGHSSSSQASSNGSPKGNWVWSETEGNWVWEEQSSSASGSYGSSESGRGSYGNDGNYFESGRIGGSNTQDGSHDSGWVRLPNGTYVRSQSSWSSTEYQSSKSLSQAELDALLRRENQNTQGGIENSDHGNNSTGWVRQPDGTMIQKTSSWSSWSMASSSYDGNLNNDHLNHIQNQQRQRPWSDLANMQNNVVPPNIEPGFEDRYRRNQDQPRSKRSYDDFEAEFDDCDERRCTLIRCTVGPLLKDESAVFKIRSRLFTETQKEMHEVTTEVFPNELPDGSIPWWVWLLAAIFGILLLLLIIFCLYKCGFFKRKRPMNSAEHEPLNNGYH